MSDAPTPRATSTPIHLWIVGVLTLLWNCVGAYDYVMTKFQVESYMSKFEPAQLDFFYGIPTWVVAFWATAVWCSVAGSILLLLRKRVAEQIFIVSFASMVITAFHNYVLSNGMEVMGTEGAIFSAVIFVVALGLWLYSRAMRVRGVLT